MKCIDCKKGMSLAAAYQLEFDPTFNPKRPKFRCYDCFSADLQKRTNAAWTNTMLSRKATLSDSHNLGTIKHLMTSLTDKRKALEALQTIDKKLGSWLYNYGNFDWFLHVQSSQTRVKEQIQEMLTTICNHEIRNRD